MHPWPPQLSHEPTVSVVFGWKGTFREGPVRPSAVLGGVTHSLWVTLLQDQLTETKLNPLFLFFYPWTVQWVLSQKICDLSICLLAYSSPALLGLLSTSVTSLWLKQWMLRFDSDVPLPLISLNVAISVNYQCLQFVIHFSLVKSPGFKLNICASEIRNCWDNLKCFLLWMSTVFFLL